MCSHEQWQVLGSHTSCDSLFITGKRPVMGWSDSFPDSSVGKDSACNAGDPSSIPGLGRSPGGGIGYPLQYFGLENSMNCTVQKVEHN